MSFMTEFLTIMHITVQTAITITAKQHNGPLSLIFSINCSNINNTVSRISILRTAKYRMHIRHNTQQPPPTCVHTYIHTNKQTPQYIGHFYLMFMFLVDFVCFAITRTACWCRDSLHLAMKHVLCKPFNNI